MYLGLDSNPLPRDRCNCYWEPKSTRSHGQRQIRSIRFEAQQVIDCQFGYFWPPTLKRRVQTRIHLLLLFHIWWTFVSASLQVRLHATEAFVAASLSSLSLFRSIPPSLPSCPSCSRRVSMSIIFEFVRIWHFQFCHREVVNFFAIFVAALKQNRQYNFMPSLNIFLFSSSLFDSASFMGVFVYPWKAVEGPIWSYVKRW